MRASPCCTDWGDWGVGWVGGWVCDQNTKGRADWSGKVIPKRWGKGQSGTRSFKKSMKMPSHQLWEVELAQWRGSRVRRGQAALRSSLHIPFLTPR